MLTGIIKEKNHILYIFSLFVLCPGFLQAQQPPEAPSKPFIFYRPVPRLELIAAASAVKPILEAEASAEEVSDSAAATRKKANDILHKTVDDMSTRSVKQSDYLQNLINFMLVNKTKNERMDAAIKRNDFELIKLGLTGLSWLDNFSCYEVVSCLIHAIEHEPYLPLSGEPTLIEQLLSRARNIDARSRDSMLNSAVKNKKIDLIPLLLYGGILTNKSKALLIEGGVPRGSFNGQWHSDLPIAIPNPTLHQIIATFNLSGKSPADLASLQQRELNLEKRNDWWTEIEVDTLQAVREAIDAGARVNIWAGDDRLYPLHIAAQYRMPSIVQFLLDNGAQVNVKDKSNKTPLHYAADAGDVKTMALLVDHGAEIDAVAELSCCTPFHKAVLSGNVEAATYLLSHGAQVNKQNKYDETALHLAAASGNREMMQLLLNEAKGTHIDVKNNRGETPLYTAAFCGNVAAAELLLSHGAETNLQDHYHDTPLHNAHNVEIAKLLLANRASTNVKNVSGQMPLHYAACRGNIGLATLLLDHNAPIEAKDNEGKTPLHKAAFRGCTDLALVLLDHKAPIEAKDNYDKTPLYYAVRACRVDMVKLLLERGANSSHLGDALERYEADDVHYERNREIRKLLKYAPIRQAIKGCNMM